MADTTPDHENSKLSEAARKMKTAGSHEERSKAASETDRAGGEARDDDEDGE
ncbi:hypothetical protein [Streptomyces sp. KS 21]|uniref:hypothetical protein n=1 Tax=Streptomyces sp. KS 21 TaxID=2485150 RepID=UPI0010E85E84|nr:hypothetical protein [Streptomyces sp. KS 21]TDU67983.1 hypothetical protein EDD91_8046 [Streptomyces sp. KS 21]